MIQPDEFVCDGCHKIIAPAEERERLGGFIWHRSKSCERKVIERNIPR